MLQTVRAVAAAAREREQVQAQQDGSHPLPRARFGSAVSAAVAASRVQANAAEMADYGYGEAGDGGGMVSPDAYNYFQQSYYDGYQAHGYPAHAYEAPREAQAVYPVAYVQRLEADNAQLQRYVAESARLGQELATLQQSHAYLQSQYHTLQNRATLQGATVKAAEEELQSQRLAAEALQGDKTSLASQVVALKRHQHLTTASSSEYDAFARFLPTVIMMDNDEARMLGVHDGNTVATTEWAQKLIANLAKVNEAQARHAIELLNGDVPAATDLYLSAPIAWNALVDGTLKPTADITVLPFRPRAVGQKVVQAARTATTVNKLFPSLGGRRA